MRWWILGLFALTLVFSNACAHVPPSETTTGMGFRVFYYQDSPITPADVDIAAHVTAQMFAQVYGRSYAWALGAIKRRVHDVSIEDTTMYMDGGCEYGCLGVYTSFLHEIRFVEAACIAQTALAHEFIHAILDELGNSDGEHADPRAWCRKGGPQSAEYQANEWLAARQCNWLEEFCP